MTTGMRRITGQQPQPLRALGREITPEIIEREKWNAFWDCRSACDPQKAGVPGASPVLPASPRRYARRRHLQRDRLQGEDGWLAAGSLVSRPELGNLFRTPAVHRLQGPILLRQEAIAKTEEPSVAYHYRAGLKGFRIDSAKRVIWRDAARGWQKYEFGGSPNVEPVGLRPRNRLAIVEAGAGSVTVFPPPRKFFFAREIELNLGYVYYRKDDASSFSVGVRQSDLWRSDLWRSDF